MAGDLLAGFLGSLVGLSLHDPKKLTFWQKIGIIASGVLCSVYLTPIVISWLAWSPESSNGLSFLVGMLGLSVAKKITVNFGFKN